jgi:hypothetical protein
MILNIEWSRPIRLEDGADSGLIYTINLEKLPKLPGIYIFGRTWGRNFEALYVGKANDLRSRVKGQLNNVRLMQHVKKSKSGNRVLFIGVTKAKQGQ